MYKHPKLTKEEETMFRTTRKCWICEKENNTFVKDHCHLTGKNRGAACNTCNLNFHHLKKTKKGKVKKPPQHELPVFFHSLKGYDGHFIIQEASKYTHNVNAIMQSFEKYMTFKFMNLKFVDSMQFMNTSLEKLADNLIIKESVNDGPIFHDYSKFKHMIDHFGDKTPLVARKGLYPYEYVQSEKDFDLPNLPPRESFYSSLKNETPTEIEYQDARNVFEEMECKTFGDYHDLNLTCDVLLLADILTEFRDVLRRQYRFDVLHYISLPSFASDAMLFICDRPLGLIHNEKTREFFESSKRGGIVQARCKRHSAANNKY